jgi:hypothetical protein
LCLQGHGQAGHGNCYGNTVTQGSPNKGPRPKDLKIQVRKAAQSIYQSEIKVEAIEATIYEIEEFYPKIKIIRRPDATGEEGFNSFADKMLISVA